MAGVALASAGAIAVNPVLATPPVEELEAAAHELAAFTNPLTTLQNAFAKTFENLNTAGADATASAAALAQTLSSPAVQAQFTGILGAATDPQRILGTFAALPGYGDRLAAAGSGFSAQIQEALAALPGVLQLSAGFLAEGKFLEAYAEVNLWFLTAGLSDLRGSLLDALRVPGDFLDSIGLEPLARILGTTWMDQAVDAQGRPGYGPGLLSRAIIGNFGRAVLGPPVTAIFQTVEIMDAVGIALQTGDLTTAVSELINAPIKIASAFVNGYVPAFVTDPNSPIPPGPGQSFPGLLGPTGTFDFIFRQIPAEIVKSLQVVRPALPAGQVQDTSESFGTTATGSPSDLPLVDESALLELKAPVAEIDGAPAPSADTTTPESTDPPAAVGSEITQEDTAATDGTDGTTATDGTTVATDGTVGTDGTGAAGGEGAQTGSTLRTKIRGTWSRGNSAGTWSRGSNGAPTGTAPSTTPGATTPPTGGGNEGTTPAATPVAPVTSTEDTTDGAANDTTSEGSSDGE